MNLSSGIISEIISEKAVLHLSDKITFFKFSAMPHLSRESPLFVQVLFQSIVRSIMVWWKTLSAECGKCGLWKIWSVESAECRKFQFSISISGEMRRNSVLTIKKKNKKRYESLHFKMRSAGMVMSVVVFTNAPVL